MTPRRRFFLPAMGLTLLFAALGPAIGGGLFIPLAVLTEAPAESGAALHIVGIATLIGHAFALIPAYLLGIWPAALTGILYALWDAWTPYRYPRALAAAVIAGLVTYAGYLWVASISATFIALLPSELLDDFNEYVSGDFDAELQRVLVGSGAVAGLACAMVARLIGLRTTQPETPRTVAE